MDIVASPVSSERPTSTNFPDFTSPTSDLHNTQYITTQESSEHPTELQKPPLLKHVSSPAYSSPLRHHRRSPSVPHKVKETLNARSEYLTSQDDGSAEHRINQYIIKQEIGRGSFGAVHIAVDQYGKEYAVKEFSKSRLRKRAQSHILRKPLNQRRRGALQGFNSPLHRRTGDESSIDLGNPLDLIKEEIAIMKKLNHPNLVQLIEVLDDPSEDSLYMVMEICKKGVAMRIDLDLDSDPYSDETCRLYFRDLILGIEYLHAQGIVHRDIKPDNCLINNDDVLKVVDFGVSEMFEKDSEMLTAKSAGSPAFLPPELCVAKHGDVSGRAADIWSMGVTLFCLKYGRLPFHSHQIIDLYEEIKNAEPDVPSEPDVDFRDLIYQILEKDPSKRIKMPQLREHPWVTKRGEDPLLSEAENISEVLEPPTDAEVEAAITSNMRNLLTVVKAVKKFKSLTANKRPPIMTSILDANDQGRFSLPPTQLAKSRSPHLSLETRSQSLNTDNRKPTESVLVAEGVHRDLSTMYNVKDPMADGKSKFHNSLPMPSTKHGSDDEDEDALARLATNIDLKSGQGRLPPFRSSVVNARTIDDFGRRGQAHDPLEDQLYLRIGPSTFAGHSISEDGSEGFGDDLYMVSESPGAADVDIYETAYRDEIERILAQAERQEKEPQVYLTRRVDEKLLQLSGLAGKLMAHGEEAKSQFMDYTQFTARRAKATEVSRALREAARAEYEKRRQERKAWIEASKAEKAEKAKVAAATAPLPAPPTAPPQTPPVEIAQSKTSESPGLVSPKPLETSYSWRAKAIEGGRHAKTSVLGLVDTLKKNRKSKDDVT